MSDLEEALEFVREADAVLIGSIDEESETVSTRLFDINDVEGVTFVNGVIELCETFSEKGEETKAMFGEAEL